MFVEENWAKLREKHPKMATKQLLKLIHQNYKELSDKEKVSSEKGWFKKGGRFLIFLVHRQSLCGTSNYV